MHTYTMFKADALGEETLQQMAPSIFASGPMTGVSLRYTFVPTARIVSGLRDLDWVPVGVDEQKIRQELRRGYQKHMIRFRRANQMESVAEWNIELVLINSHDAGCAYQLHAGLYRRICGNGLVVNEGSFEAIRFRHAGLNPEAVVQASLKLLDYLPRLGQRIESFRGRMLEGWESSTFARRAILQRYETLEAAPVEPDTLLKVRRAEDEGNDLWRTLNRVQENLLHGGVSDCRRDKRGRLRVVRRIGSIDTQVSLNKAIWGLAERAMDGTLMQGDTEALS